MIARILWSFVLVTTLYVVAVFVRPADADKLGEALGILPLNAVLREAKEGGSQDIRVNLEAGTGGIYGDFQDKLKMTREAVDATKSTIQLKVDQANQAVTSVQNAAGAIEKAKNDISVLATLSGSSGTGSTASGSVTASGSASAGTGTFSKTR